MEKMQAEANLRSIEMKLKQVEENKMRKIEKKLEELRNHSEVVESRFHQIKELSNMTDIEAETVIKMKIHKSEKNRVRVVSIIVISKPI